MLKKKALMAVMLLIALQLESCGSRSNEQTNMIRFFSTYDENTRQLSNPTETIRAGKTEFVLFDYGKPFNSDSIGLSVYEDLEGERGSVYDIIETVEPESTAVVIPIEIASAGKYELVIYFESPEKPVVTSRLYVVDR